MKYFDSTGKRTKLDRRKFLYDYRGNLLFVPRVGWITEEPNKDEILELNKIFSNVVSKVNYYLDKEIGESETDTTTDVERLLSPEYREIGSGSSKQTRYLLTKIYKDRKPEEDLYSYFGRKKFNQFIQKLEKENPRKVLVGSVDITFPNRPSRFTTQEFKLTHFKDVVFIGGKRGAKGMKYTPKDIIAYYIHDALNNEEWGLYKYTTDGSEQIIPDNVNDYLKRDSEGMRLYEKRYYSEKITFELKIKTVSITDGKNVPTVGQYRKIKKSYN